MVRTNFKFGDFVRLRLARKELEGTVLESFDKDVVLLKLESGYNVGISKEKILDFEVLNIAENKQVKLIDEFGRKLPGMDKGKKTIGLIVTGGTIASKLDRETGGVKALVGIDEFRRFYPHLFESVNVKEISIPFMELSENMGWEHWKEIARETKKMLDDGEIEGVIITHGSDFLHYTASALSFFLRDLNKPVVLTFSQRSVDRASSDASFNLACSVKMALSNVAEVMIVGHGSIDDDFCFALPGTKTRKMHTSRRDTFKAINRKPIARISLDGIDFLSEYKPRNKGKLYLDLESTHKVALVKFYPGQDSEILDYYAKNCKGIVIEMSGLGHVSVSKKNSWIPRLKKIIKQGITVCATAQTINGRLNPRVYSTGRELNKIGVIFLEDMLSETAFVKLGWVLGHKKWKGKIKEKMLENISGEFSEILTE